jgi:CubicO group peptidase (beta-lactamase class C family)
LSDQSRALPDQPSLRYLKIEAKRRLAAGEFVTLHDAQLAIAREHGSSSWTALKHSIEATRGEPSPALEQVRWVVARFRDADDPAWVAPGHDELRGHFGDRYLALVPAGTMARTLGGVAARLREEIVVSVATPGSVRAQVADLRIEALAEPEPPHRLATLRLYPLGRRVADGRTATPPVSTSGDVPARAIEVAGESFAELGLVGLVVAGTTADGGPPWAVARGWADLDGPRPLRTDHRFPAYGISKLITSTAVLRLAAEGRVHLDGPANASLRTLRLADGDVTVRELLTHTGGVTSPAEQFADRVPDVVALLGPTVTCDGPRGTFAPSNAGYAMLGQLIADVTGSPYREAASRLVLEPLGMTASWFPTSWPGAETDSDPVSGYLLTDQGTFDAAPAQVSTMPAAGGLWTTAGDLVRFGRSWSSVLPAELAREALRPQAAPSTPGTGLGLGWVINPGKGVCGHSGAGPGAAASLIVRLDTGAVTVACTNRLVPVEPVNARLARPIV